MIAVLIYVLSAVLTNAEPCDLRAANGAVSEG